MEHVAIQSAALLKGKDKPNTDILFRPSKKKMPPFDCIRKNDIVYIKSSGEKEIKWKAVIDRYRYVEGEFESIEEVREMTKGTPLYDDPVYEEFWRENREYKYGTLIWLINAEKIDPIVPSARSYGNGWIVLDTPEKRKSWLGS